MKRSRAALDAPSNPFGALLAALNSYRVRYLVISGQACVYYGAIGATKDVDLWVAPTQANVTRLRRCLRELGAAQRFIPSLDTEALRRGHGIHFEVPTAAGVVIRLDLLGRPPRVDDFDIAARQAEQAEIDGVPCRIVDLTRLVNLKKTQRARDYDVIVALIEPVFEYADEHPEERKRLGKWLARELRTPESLRRMGEWPEGVALLEECDRAVCRVALDLRRSGASENEACAAIRIALRAEQNRLESEDREHWRKLLAELRAIERNHRAPPPAEPAEKDRGGD